MLARSPATTAFSQASVKRTLKRSTKALLVFVPLCWLLPKTMIVYLLCGLYDVSRNGGFKIGIADRYFLGNGVPTWLLSPLNVLFDLLALPYINKGIYRLEDLPKPYQDEIRRVIEAAQSHDLISQLEEKTRGQPRSMFFFKWYGANVDTSFRVPAFHADYRYIKTIGVSVFNQKESTSRHFGPVRATLRVLYNINPTEERSAYIEVGDTKSYWRDSQLFIFDDTLLHQSFNESDKARYCMFVDILRPSLVPAVFSAVVSVIRVVFKGANSVFYKRWKVLRA